MGLAPSIFSVAGIFVCLVLAKTQMREVESFFKEVSSREHLIAKLSDSIGYGTGIHAFKNYILRGDGFYYQQASSNFHKSLGLIDELRNSSLNELDELKSGSDLDVIESTVSLYLQNLTLAKKLKADGKSIQEVDLVVRIDDQPAIEALGRYRLMIETASADRLHQLRQFENIVFYIILGLLVASLILTYFGCRFVSCNIIKEIETLTSLSSRFRLGDDSHSSDPIMEMYSIDELKNFATSFQEMSEKLNNSYLELKKSNEDLEHFSFMISHDLQEPVKKIGLYADILELEHSDKLDDEATIYLEKIKSTSENMVGYIRALLEYVRLTQEDIHLEPIELAQVIESSIKNLEPLVRRSSIDVRWETLPKVMASPMMLGLVFRNLFENSVKFSKPGSSPKISITSNAYNDNTVEILFEDNGIGFDNRFVDKVVKPFVRVHNKRKVNGYGIGLATCKRVLAAHHSELYIKSQPGKGSQFSFFLKVA